MSEDHFASRDHAPATGSALVDLSKIRPGDEVLVRRTVAGLYSSQVNIGGENADTLLGTRPLWVSADQILAHTPKALEVGDRVKTKTVPAFASPFGIVRAIREGFAWVSRDNEDLETWAISELDRADD